MSVTRIGRETPSAKLSWTIEGSNRDLCYRSLPWDISKFDTERRTPFSPEKTKRLG